MKKTNNKGFSLVELIVVIAIMAVLVGVLAPQFLRYVEKTRLQRDNSAISEIATSIKAAMAEEDVNTAVTTGTTVAASAQTFSFAGTDKLSVELKKTVGETVKLNSNAYKNASAQPTLTITKEASTGNVTVKGTNIILKPGETATSVEY